MLEPSLFTPFSPLCNLILVTGFLSCYLCPSPSLGNLPVFLVAKTKTLTLSGCYPFFRDQLSTSQIPAYNRNLEWIIL